MTVWNLLNVFAKRNKSFAAFEAEEAVAEIWKMRLLLQKDAKRLSKVERRVRILLEQHRRIAESLAEDASSLQRNVEDAEKSMTRSEKALELLRAENEVLNDVVVPALTSGIKSVQERWNADIALSGCRQAMATPSPNREEY